MGCNNTKLNDDTDEPSKFKKEEVTIHADSPERPPEKVVTKRKGYPEDYIPLNFPNI